MSNWYRTNRPAFSATIIMAGALIAGLIFLYRFGANPKLAPLPVVVVPIASIPLMWMNAYRAQSRLRREAGDAATLATTYIWAMVAAATLPITLLLLVVGRLLKLQF